MEMEQMAVRKKISSKKIHSNSPVSAVSEKPAAATATPGPVRKKAVTKKTAVSKKKSVASKQAPPAATKKAAGIPAGPASSSANGAKPVISQQQRQQMTGDAAYLISIKRKPWQGNSETDWIAAETVIDMIFDVAD
jgi:hypothetical protein